MRNAKSNVLSFVIFKSPSKHIDSRGNGGKRGHELLGGEQEGACL